MSPSAALRSEGAFPVINRNIPAMPRVEELARDRRPGKLLPAPRRSAYSSRITLSLHRHHPGARLRARCRARHAERQPCPGTVGRHTITSERLIRIFERLRSERDLPQVLSTDNGLEFLGEAFVNRAQQAGLTIQYIQPGKPNQNGYIERFNRTFREELLDQHLFVNLDDVREAIYCGWPSTTRSAPTMRWTT